MKRIRTQNGRKFLILMISLALSFSVRSQTNPDSASHSLYAGAAFVSNMVYMGTSISQDRPVYAGSLTYGLNDKLYASVSTYHLSAFDPFLAFHTFSLSFNQGINTWFDISLGVSRYQVTSSLTDTLFNSFTYGNFAVGLDWKILYTNISAGGIFSEGSSAYMQLRNSRYFKTPEFNSAKVYFSFDPYINMLLGSLTRTETSEGTTIGISQPFSSKGSGRNSSQTTSTFFGLMEIDLGIPVACNAGKFTIEAEPGYVLPFYSDTEIFNPKGFLFLLNFYFRIL
jgi:hypothetical protein